MADFKDRLRELIKEENQSQKVIAEHLSISPQTLSYYVNGREPNFDTLKTIAAYFNVSIDYLVGYSAAKKPENITLIENLGLSNEGIEIIKDLPSNDYISFMENKEDNRTLLDIFNNMIESEPFTVFLKLLQLLTAPQNDWSTYQDIDLNKIIESSTEYIYIFKKDTYERMLKDKLAEIILEIKLKTQ